MHAHLARHVYHRHSHETYSFGVTEEGNQAFTCRGAAHTSVTGTVMAFNPDDPHDGHAADALGFTYRIIHIGPELVTAVLGDLAGRETGPPLFPHPIVRDAELAAGLRALHTALLAGAEVTADDLAAVTGRSRFAVYRAFRAVYGMAPSDYQRLLRLRTARRLIAQGRSLSEAAADAGFADQSHLTRWFVRCYGMNPEITGRPYGPDSGRFAPPPARVPGTGGKQDGEQQVTRGQ